MRWLAACTDPPYHVGRPNSKKRLAGAVVKVVEVAKTSGPAIVNKTELCRQYLTTNEVPATKKNLNAARRQLYRVHKDRPGHTALSRKEELVLVGIISGISCATQPVSKLGLREIAERVHGPKFGPDGVNAFLKRHKK